MGLSTYGSVPVFVYVWGEMFDLSTDDTAWSAAIMSGFFFLTGRRDLTSIDIVSKLKSSINKSLIGVQCSLGRLLGVGGGGGREDKKPGTLRAMIKRKRGQLLK